MNLSQRKAKIMWQCRRGMLELDLLLISFVNEKLDELNEEQLGTFETLLTASDPELYSWLMNLEEPVSEELKELVAIILSHHSH